MIFKKDILKSRCVRFTDSQWEWLCDQADIHSEEMSMNVSASEYLRALVDHQMKKDPIITIQE